MSIQRTKGTMAESAVVAYLRGNGFIHAERRALKGSLDQGDVAGCPGLAIEVKYANSGLRLASWVAETEIERLNAKADHGVLVIKPPGLGAKSTKHWFAVMQVQSFDRLVRQAEQETGVAPGAYPLHCEEPTRLTAMRIGVKLNANESMKSLLLHADHVYALTLTPPGAKEQPHLHYRVVYLRDIVRILRDAGYGDPLPGP